MELSFPKTWPQSRAAIRQIFSATSANSLSPRRQIAQVQRWNSERAWGFTVADFQELPPPPRVRAGTDYTVVLTPYLGTVAHTAAELWEIAAGHHSRAWKLDELRFDDDHFRLLPGAAHRPGLRWTVMNPNAHRDGDYQLRPRNVQSVQFSAGPEILAAAAHMPAWVQFTQQGGYEPAMIMGGYQARKAPDDAWDDVPIMFYSELNESLELTLTSALELDSELAVPMIISA
ncbi:hypothetical protein J5X84_39250 [Streptosporangiaceae bacterium NEAU-GS5]|nr:hypothetical protein [Streptosporangiaceae bacterium NEAU-GS5]